MLELDQILTNYLSDGKEECKKKTCLPGKMYATRALVFVCLCLFACVCLCVCVCVCVCPCVKSDFSRPANVVSGTAQIPF